MVRADGFLRIPANSEGVGAGEQVFDHFDMGLDTGCGGERCPDLAAQEGDPQETLADLGGRLTAQNVVMAQALAHLGRWPLQSIVLPRAGAASIAAWPVIPYMRANLRTKRRTLAQADAIIAVSSAIARDLAARAPELSGTPMFTIPNPVDMTALDEAHLRLPRPMADPYVLYAGKLAVNKGVQFLLPAYVNAGLDLPLVQVTAESVGASKPDPEGFLKGAAENGATARRQGNTTILTWSPKVTAASGKAYTINGYVNAQISDYPPFRWRPPLRLTVTAQASSAALRGTAGFGFWNHPFSPVGWSLRLPQAIWFFFGSPPNNMALAQGVPGYGWKAATISANRWPFALLSVETGSSRESARQAHAKTPLSHRAWWDEPADAEKGGPIANAWISKPSWSTSAAIGHLSCFPMRVLRPSLPGCRIIPV